MRSVPGPSSRPVPWALGSACSPGRPPAPPWLRAASRGTDLTLRPEQWPAALLATAAVPGLIRPVEGLLPRGALGIDGGIADYISAPSRATATYPFIRIFYPHLVPGWFDKPFTRRRLDPTSVDHVLLMAPSLAFVAGLPGGKIPDRKDPQTLGVRPRRTLGPSGGGVSSAGGRLGRADGRGGGWAWREPCVPDGEGAGLGHRVTGRRSMSIAYQRFVIDELPKGPLEERHFRLEEGVLPRAKRRGRSPSGSF